MTSKELAQKLALERCRMNLSQICALNHLVLLHDESFSAKAEGVSMDALIENLNRDFALIEGLLEEVG